MKRIIYCLSLALSLFATSPFAYADPHDLPKIKTSEALEKMKQLVGTWRGTGSDTGAEPFELNYRLSSGGSVVIETIAPGSNHEMITTYYDEDNKLTMTHYCMLGNHPVMALKESSAKEFYFETDKKGPLHGKPHMNSLKLTFVGPNTIQHKWTMTGKEGHDTVFTLERKS